MHGATPSRSLNSTRSERVYERMRRVVTPAEWALHAPLIERINALKASRGAVILAHNYQVPEIFHGVADIVGDSLGLAMDAAKTNADVIVVCGVHFMAETAKLVNPSKTVLVPTLQAGCSLADSITAADVRLMRDRYPGIPVVTYVNTSAEVKAESDICCTSGNAVQIVRTLGAERIIFLPDEFLAKYVASQVPEVDVIAWKGHCEVHERFTGEQLRAYREGDPHLQILAHPECPPDVLDEADYVGSTSGMIRYVEGISRRDEGARVVLITECSMSDNVSIAYPNVEFVRPCNLCPHMKQNTLNNLLTCLESMAPEVRIEASIMQAAQRAVKSMLDLTPR